MTVVLSGHISEMKMAAAFPWQGKGGFETRPYVTIHRTIWFRGNRYGLVKGRIGG